MARYLSAEEALAELKRDLGPEFGEAFHTLQNDLVWLHLKWRQFRVLFGTKPERVDLLNEAAGNFFNVVQDVLWDDTLLSICRLTDDPGRGDRKRLSIRQLPAMIADPAVSAEVQTRVNAAIDKARFARDWRNRRIAHRDLLHALDPKASPLAEASRKSVEDCLQALRDVLNTIDNRLRQTTYAYEVVDPVHGAESLLYVIRDGLEAQRENEQAMREGRLPPEKWGPGPAV
jgi:hypothetical protein